jgi:hypothetical protein
MYGRQAYMHQNLFNAEFAPVTYLMAGDKNLQVIRVMKALTKVLHKSFCCTYTCLVISITAFIGSIDLLFGEKIFRNQQLISF